MLAIIGILIVFGAVIGGYLLEHGNLKVLLQPAELVIIGGAAFGTIFISNTPEVLKGMLAGLIGVFGSSKFNKKLYLETLKVLYGVMQKARKGGLSSLEADIEDPAKSQIFAKFPPGKPDHHVRDFVCDTLRMAVTGGPTAFDLDQMMELDMEVHHHYANQPAAALNTVADALPGLGIVAAVLGVVITMGALGGPPEEIGHKVAAALVGTFLGILLCYGVFGPMASRMAKAAEEEGHYYHVLRVALTSFVKGVSPLIAIEFARRAVPGLVRPSFSELEKACRGGGAPGAPGAGAAGA
ncbi:MAG: flagellar motor stator protein MotA [Acidobacteria bacterium]|nr:flagellar motor stator protein MotA [Acidobacteriota bacterium]